MSKTGLPKLLAMVGLFLLSGCGTADTALLVTVRCDEPLCDLVIPTDTDFLRLTLSQIGTSAPPRMEDFALTTSDTFPLSVSVVAGPAAQPGDVIAAVELRAGGSTGTVVATGEGSAPLVEGSQTEIVIALVP